MRKSWKSFNQGMVWGISEGEKLGCIKTLDQESFSGFQRSDKESSPRMPKDPPPKGSSSNHKHNEESALLFQFIVQFLKINEEKVTWGFRHSDNNRREGKGKRKKRPPVYSCAHTGDLRLSIMRRK